MNEAKTRTKKLGQILVEAKLITDEQLEKALLLSQQNGTRIGTTLIDMGLITPKQLAMFVSLQWNVPFVNLEKQEINPKALELVPESTARRYQIMPLSIVDGSITIAMGDPGDINVIESLETITRMRISPVHCVPQEVLEAIDRNYSAGGEIEKQLSQLPSRTAILEDSEMRISADAIAQAPVVRALDLLIKQAVRDRASDIHIEPQEDHLRVRYRIDGILHETLKLPLSVHRALVSRLKIMASLNIAERRRPQDGQITFPIADRDIDIRVATANTVNGEHVVLRILDKGFAFLPLPDIGFTTDTLEQYQNQLRTPFGMILISGPTGSGKTTTLYASVNQMDNTGRNTITIEDPVEYRFGNINQMSVNPQAGVSFAAGLRACMRLDPDVILVGEIRDAETAQIGVQAALTGHLVLSSVHANDTASTVFRMIDLGVEPFLVSSALIGVIAQRMVRRVCPYCAHAEPAKPEEKMAYEKEMGEEMEEFIYGSGCNFCANTGYLGRTAIFEVMTVTESLRRMILSNASTDDLRNQAYKDGMVSLWRDGMLKVKQGVTTPFEAQRNVYSLG